MERIDGGGIEPNSDEAASPGARVESDDQVVARLAKLPTLEYDRVRRDEADAIKVQVATLDREVAAVRKGSSGVNSKGPLFPAVDPWSEPVAGAELLDEILSSLQRYIVCEPETAIAATLWIGFTWFIDHVQVAPLALITAPEMRCGKSRLLAFMGKLVRRPLIAANISSAAMFRVIEGYAPTLLVDEADTFLDRSDELRGLIDSGHTRDSAVSIRMGGENHEQVMQFSTWGAKAIAGIGKYHATIMDRSVPLVLRRKLPTEVTERLLHTASETFQTLVSKLARYSEDNGAEIKHARPRLPAELHDRAQDNWEPLLAIADMAGGDWPALARKAALKLSGEGMQTVSISTELLTDIREILESREGDNLFTTQLLAALNEDDESPWATINNGRPMSAVQLSKRLAAYNIKSGSVRIGDETAKGYKRQDFEDAFNRYLPLPTGDSGVTRSQTEEYGGTLRLPAVTPDDPCDGTGSGKVTLKPAETAGCDGVTANPADVEEDMMEEEI